MREFLLMMLVQFVSYTNLTINFRAIAHEQYLMAGGTASLAAILSYTIVRRIVKDDTRFGIAGLVVGAFAADIVGIYLTRYWG
jgi:hypothetical protein